MIEVKDLTFSYNQKEFIKDIHFKVEKGISDDCIHSAFHVLGSGSIHIFHDSVSDIRGIGQ